MRWASPSAAVVPRALLAMGISGGFYESIREVTVRVKLKDLLLVEL